MERLAIKLGSRKFHFPKVNKIGSIIGHAIDYNRGEPAAHTQQKLTQVSPPPPNSGKTYWLSINVFLLRKYP